MWNAYSPYSMARGAVSPPVHVSFVGSMDAAASCPISCPERSPRGQTTTLKGTTDGKTPFAVGVRVRCSLLTVKGAFPLSFASHTHYPYPGPPRLLVVHL